MKTIRLLLAFCAANLLCAVDLDQGFVMISEKLDRFNALLNDPQLDTELKREQLSQIVENSIDFEAITLNVLGSHASKLTPEQSNRFSAAFKTILKRLFVDDLMHFGNDKITLSEYVWMPDKEEVLVKVLGRQSSGFAANNRDRQRTRTNYILREKESKWRIVDLTINGVNIAGNYRSQIDALVSRGKSAEKVVQSFEKLAKGK